MNGYQERSFLMKMHDPTSMNLEVAFLERLPSQETATQDKSASCSSAMGAEDSIALSSRGH
jgi:hypothetical protein